MGGRGSSGSGAGTGGGFRLPTLKCDWNVICVKPHYDEIVKRRKSNEISVSAGNP